MKTLLLALALAVCALATAPAHAAPEREIERTEPCDPYDPNDILDPRCVEWL